MSENETEIKEKFAGEFESQLLAALHDMLDGVFTNCKDPRHFICVVIGAGGDVHAGMTPMESEYLSKVFESVKEQKAQHESESDAKTKKA